MRKLLLAGIAAGLLTTATPLAPLAQAHPDHHYRGGCSFTVVNDITPGGQIGGRRQWTGEVDLVAVATTADGLFPTPADVVTASCDLWINGTLVWTVLGPYSNTTAVEAADQLTFLADATDVVSLCDDIDVAGDAHYVCRDATVTPVVPTPMTELVVTVVDLVNFYFFERYNPEICATFRFLAPTVNTVDPAIAYINEWEGDVYLFGEQVWECPPAPPGGQEAFLYADRVPLVMRVRAEVD